MSRRREDLARLVDELGLRVDVDTARFSDEIAMQSSLMACYDAMSRAAHALRDTPRWRVLRRRRLRARLDGWHELADAFSLRVFEHHAAWREEQER